MTIVLDESFGVDARTSLINSFGPGSGLRRYAGALTFEKQKENETMNRTSIFALLTSLVMSACSHERASQHAGQSQSPTGGVVGGPSLAAAAAKVTDACSLAPADLTQKLVPGASPPQSEQFPRRCTLSNGKSALGITIDVGPAEPVKGAEFIPGLAEG